MKKFSANTSLFTPTTLAITIGLAFLPAVTFAQNTTESNGTMSVTVKNPFPVSPSVSYANLHMMAYSGQQKEAQRLAEEYLKHRENASIRTLYAKMLAWDKQFEAAKEQLQMILKKHPGDYEANNTLADVEVMKGDYSLAVEALNNALRYDPTDQQLLDKRELVRAQALVAGNQRNKAIALLQTYVEEPNALEVRNYLGKQLLATKQYDAAKAQYEFIVRKNPSHLEAQAGLANIAVVNGNYKHAIEVANAGLTHSPNNGMFLAIKKVAQEKMDTLAKPAVMNNANANVSAVTAEASPNKLQKIATLVANNGNPSVTDVKTTATSPLSRGPVTTASNTAPANSNIVFLDGPEENTAASDIKIVNKKPNTQSERVHVGSYKQAKQKNDAAKPQPSNCDVNKGFELVNYPKPPTAKISAILSACDRSMPNDPQVLLLHGVFARKLEMNTNKNYPTSLMWFQKAVAAAKPNDYGPKLELATTYEWASQPEKARVIYEDVLKRDPNNRAALLGIASVDRAEYKFNEAMKIYNNFLQKNPQDVDALIGVASSDLANKRFETAYQNYTKVQRIQPNNLDAIEGLKMLSNATRNRISIFQDMHGVPPKTSYGTGINYVRDLNATDTLQVLFIHNSNEIQYGFFNNPAYLPKNSLLLGFQRQYSERYGWGGSYDYRRHVNQGVENHIEVNGNYYFTPKYQVYGGVQESFPTPFNYQLYWLGGTLYTDSPVNFSLTGYSGIQELPDTGIIHSPAFSFDLSKEFADNAFYDIGISYLPSEPNKWGYHGSFVLPTFKNQALEAWYEYYCFNQSYYGGLGWRVYW